MGKQCHICGCTEENPCITEEGPCYWAFEDRSGPVCSACIVKLPPDPKREKYPKDNVILPKLCRTCANLIEGEPHRGKACFTCELKKFGEDVYFLWSGIKRPNKTVAAARQNCKEWKIQQRWQPTEEVN